MKKVSMTVLVTFLSMLKALHTRHQKGEMALEKAKQLGVDLLRELRYGTEGYFWADTKEGVNVVLYGRKDHPIFIIVNHLRSPASPFGHEGVGST